MQVLSRAKKTVVNAVDRWANAKVAAVVVTASAAATSAQAAAVDVTGVVTDIGAQTASIVAIGGAVLLVYVAVKAFKWVRSALS